MEYQFYIIHGLWKVSHQFTGLQIIVSKDAILFEINVGFRTFAEGVAGQAPQLMSKFPEFLQNRVFLEKLIIYCTLSNTVECCDGITPISYTVSGKSFREKLESNSRKTIGVYTDATGHNGRKYTLKIFFSKLSNKLTYYPAYIYFLFAPCL